MVLAFLAACACCPLLPTSAQAEPPNAVTAFLQPLSNCEISFIGNLVCTGHAGLVVPIVSAPGTDPSSMAPAPSSNPTLAIGGGYRLCWRTASGETAPTGATCAAGNVAPTSPRSHWSTRYPVTFSGTAYQGCGPIPSVNADDIAFFVRDPGPCIITITTDDAPGLTGTQTSFILQAGAARVPLLMGEVAPATSRVGRVGGSWALQEVLCRHQVEYLGNVKFGCNGVMLNWSILTGSRSCRLTADTRPSSEGFGTVFVNFRRVGTCTIRGSYPRVPGSSDAYETGVYTFVVRPKGATAR